METNGQLKAIVERVERLDAQIKDLNDDKADVFQEAKSTGLDVKILKRVIAARRKDPAKLREEDEIFALYMSAAGGEHAS
jgi:uncharacterized protein (UPF0335 family)